MFGHPIAHSLSPLIHAAFGQATGVDLRYRAIDAPPQQFADALARFAADGGRGANITLPLKQAAFALCASHGAHAQRAGAVNTLVREGRQWHGHNTDGIGLVRDLGQRHRLDLREQRVLLLGAGGAAHGVAPALLDAGIGQLLIVNRSRDRAESLAARLRQPSRVRIATPAQLATLDAFDLLINATSAARGGALFELPDTLLQAQSVALDLGYGPAADDFLAWAQRHGCALALDGLGMLIEQAAESFLLWHGLRPPTDAIHAQLRARLPLAQFNASTP